jgi:hypothetical protein
MFFYLAYSYLCFEWAKISTKMKVFDGFYLKIDWKNKKHIMSF